MDPRDRADALLARARARGAFVVTPDNATSPMDSANTQQIPHAAIAEIDRGHDPDTTTQLPASLIAENDHPLAGSSPTRRLESPGNGHKQDTTPLAREPHSTRPLPHPNAPVARAPQATTPLTPRPAASPIASPLKDPVPDPEDTGLVPTVKQNSGKSNLSRRLDGI